MPIYSKICLNVSNNVHIECLRFCFIPVIEADLTKIMDSWNNHRLRKQNSICPPGRPSFLYSSSDALGCTDMQVNVDLDILDTCEEIYSTDIPEMGALDKFSETALEIMAQHNLTLPRTLLDAMDLFGTLVVIINEM